MIIHLIDPYARARGNGYQQLSWNDKNMINLFKAHYMSKHGACNWVTYINDRGDARIIEPVLSDKEKEEVKAIERATLLSFERDAQRGWTLD